MDARRGHGNLELLHVRTEILGGAERLLLADGAARIEQIDVELPELLLVELVTQRERNHRGITRAG